MSYLKYKFSHMETLKQQMLEHFDESGLLHRQHKDGKGLEALFPIEMGSAPWIVRFSQHGHAIARCFYPIRIPRERTAEFAELVIRVNNCMTHPQYGLCLERNLVFSTSKLSEEELDDGCCWNKRLIRTNCHWVLFIHDAMVNMLFHEYSAELAASNIKNPNLSNKDEPAIDSDNLEKFRRAFRIKDFELSLN